MAQAGFGQGHTGVQRRVAGGRLQSLLGHGQGILVISQFTLHASTKKGNRPSYIKAARPEYAIMLYEKFVERLKKVSNNNVKTGVFAADMKVNLINDGPVTIVIDSKQKE